MSLIRYWVLSEKTGNDSSRRDQEGPLELMKGRRGQVAFPRNAPDFNITQAGSTCQEECHCSPLRCRVSFRIGDAPSLRLGHWNTRQFFLFLERVKCSGLFHTCGNRKCGTINLMSLSLQIEGLFSQDFLHIVPYRDYKVYRRIIVYIRAVQFPSIENVQCFDTIHFLYGYKRVKVRRNYPNEVSAV